MIKVYFLPNSRKELDRLPGKAKNKIEKAIKKINQEPTSGKKLRGDLKGLYAIRVWPYRIIYKIERNYIVIIHILHRQKAYK